MSRLLDLWLTFAVVVGVCWYAVALFFCIACVGFLSGPRGQRQDLHGAGRLFRTRVVPLVLVGTLFVMGSLSVSSWYKDHAWGPRSLCTTEAQP